MRKTATDQCSRQERNVVESRDEDLRRIVTTAMQEFCSNESFTEPNGTQHHMALDGGSVVRTVGTAEHRVQEWTGEATLDTTLANGTQVHSVAAILCTTEDGEPSVYVEED
jgi:hypothetical protein